MTSNSDSSDLKDPLAQKAAIVPATSCSLPSRTSQKPPKARTWNTDYLWWRTLSDATAAACASGLVSPAITIIDRSIIERASTRTTIRSSILASVKSLALRPSAFFLSRPFLLVSSLYFGTYFTANSIDSLTSTINDKPPKTTTSGLPKFLATSSVNMSLCLYKDSQFARIFGSPISPSRTIPIASYAIFALRDAATIYASFNLPPLIAPKIPFSTAAEGYMTRASAAQFLAPAAMQLMSTPLHLLGFDLYNRPMGNGIGWNARVYRVGRDWLGSSVARMARIVPAFGIGGVVNARVRARLMGHCQE